MPPLRPRRMNLVATKRWYGSAVESLLLFLLVATVVSPAVSHALRCLFKRLLLLASQMIIFGFFFLLVVRCFSVPPFLSSLIKRDTLGVNYRKAGENALAAWKDAVQAQAKKPPHPGN